MIIDEEKKLYITKGSEKILEKFDMPFVAYDKGYKITIEKEG